MARPGQRKNEYGVIDQFTSSFFPGDSSWQQQHLGAGSVNNMKLGTGGVTGDPRGNAASQAVENLTSTYIKPTGLDQAVNLRDRSVQAGVDGGHDFYQQGINKAIGHYGSYDAASQAGNIPDFWQQDSFNVMQENLGNNIDTMATLGVNQTLGNQSNLSVDVQGTRGGPTPPEMRTQNLDLGNMLGIVEPRDEMMEYEMAQNKAYASSVDAAEARKITSDTYSAKVSPSSGPDYENEFTNMQQADYGLNPVVTQSQSDPLSRESIAALENQAKLKSQRREDITAAIQDVYGKPSSKPTAGPSYNQEMAEFARRGPEQPGLVDMNKLGLEELWSEDVQDRGILAADALSGTDKMAGVSGGGSLTDVGSPSPKQKEWQVGEKSPNLGLAAEKHPSLYEMAQNKAKMAKGTVSTDLPDVATKAGGGFMEKAGKALAWAPAIGAIFGESKMKGALGDLKSARSRLEGAEGALANAKFQGDRSIGVELSEDRRRVGELEKERIAGVIEKIRTQKTGGLRSGSQEEAIDDAVGGASTRTDVRLADLYDEAEDKKSAFAEENREQRAKISAEIADLNTKIDEMNKQRVMGPINAMIDVGSNLLMASNPVLAIGMQVGKSLIA